MRCFLFLLPNHTNTLVCFFYLHYFSDEPEVFLPKYSQTAILYATHFRRVVNGGSGPHCVIRISEQNLIPLTEYIFWVKQNFFSLTVCTLEQYLKNGTEKFVLLP